MSFPTTNWTILAQASLNGDTTGRVSLEGMCRNYWAPVHTAIARRWPWPGEAEDLTQDFFVHLMERGTLRRADRERGRFRGFLLGALRYFLSHRLEAAKAAKRGGGQAALELHEWMAPTVEGDPAFDRAWAVAILLRAMAKLEAETGVDAFPVLRRFLPGAETGLSYDEAARISGRPVGTVKSDVNRLRRRLREVIRHEVALTVSAPHEIDEEVTYLHEMLRR